MKFVRELRQINEATMTELHAKLNQLFDDYADDYRSISPDAFDGVTDGTLAMEMSEMLQGERKFQRILKGMGLPGDWLDTEEGEDFLGDWAYSYIKRKGLR